jgi:hypothetical protein
MNETIGYYKVGDRLFYSKIQAILYASEKNQRPEWIFNNSVFDSNDWTAEPSESLSELYNQRAKELREKYDYIILLYSAGSDSENILQSFLRQGLHVDELLTHTYEKVAKDVTELNYLDHSPSNSLYSEYVLHTVPRLKQISKQYPNIKITTWDVSDDILNHLVEFDSAEWVTSKKEWLNISSGVRYNLLRLQEIRKTLDVTKKIAILMGIDKPKTAIDRQTNNFFIFFTDLSANNGPAFLLLDHDNVTVENFYWHPASIRMLTKQAHIMKRHVESTPSLVPYWYLDQINSKVWSEMHEPTIRSVVYRDTWNHNWYQTSKPVRFWRCEFDNWFFQKYSGSKIHSIWKEGIDHVVNHANSYVKYFGDEPDGLVPFYHRYDIGKFNHVQKHT